jgi:uncharacterized protein (TIGR00661 family)
LTFLIFGLLNYSILHQIKYPKLGHLQKISHGKEKPLLLFSCLDWGLGHTTRSIPLIQEFEAQGCEVIVACNSIQKKILYSELRNVRYVDLDGYGVTYADGKWATRFKIAWQFRKILTRIKLERRWVHHFVAENRIDALVSDNRYGFTHPLLPSILITHQLFVQTGFGGLIDNALQRFLYYLIKRFVVCWVPDFASENSLAGILSHPKTFPPIPVKYIGPVSRFSNCRNEKNFNYDVVIILSGPEPQRTILEQAILNEIQNWQKKIFLVRGLPDKTLQIDSKNLQVKNHLDASALNEIICQSEYVICRPGYTSMMDVLKLRKKTIVVSTPGQGEQAYLAQYLSSKQLVMSIPQKNFSLTTALDQAEKFQFAYINNDMQDYKVAISEFVRSLSSLSLSSRR